MHREININELKFAIEAVSLTYDNIEEPSEFDWDLVPVLKVF